MTAENPLSEAVIAECHRAYSQMLENYAWAVTRDASLAKDAVQNAFLQLTRFGGNVTPEAYKSWLFKVTHREAVRLRQKEWKQAVRETVNSVRESEACYTVEPSHRLEAEEELHRLRNAVGALPEDQRQIVELRIYKEKSFVEIAQTLSIPVGTALSRMRLALERLKRTTHPHDNT